jgi:4-amino-4-deoxy-L-arabinose transferase-like glycosyltransferase
MPGFPALIAVPIALFGPSKLIARLWLGALCTLACYFNFLLGRDLHSERTGLIAALLTAISPVFVAFAPEMLCESTFAVALCWTLWLGTKALAPLDQFSLSARLWAALMTGITSAAAISLKPSWILAVPVFAGVLGLYGWMITSGPTWKRASYGAVLGLVALLGMFLALLPWGLRNQQVSGHFKLTTFWMGPSLYDGLNPEANGDSDMTFYDRDNLLGRLTEYEVDQHYQQAAWQFARENPDRTLELAWIKFKRYWSPWPNAEQFQNPVAQLASSIFYVPALILAVWGAWLERRNWRLLLICLGPILYFCALHCLFVSSLRYRLPGEYPLMVLSAIGLQRLCVWWRPQPSEVRP